MNLHGYPAREGIAYGSPEGLDFTNIYFYTVTRHALHTSMQLARERGQRFAGFEQSRYASGAYFDKYLQEEWQPKTERVRALFARAGISARPGKLAPAARRCHALWHLQSLSAGGAAHRLDLVHQPCHLQHSPDRLED